MGNRPDASLAAVLLFPARLRSRLKKRYPTDYACPNRHLSRPINYKGCSADRSINISRRGVDPRRKG